MHIITRIAILFAAFELSFIGCDARAQDCPTGDVAKAEAAVLQAQATAWEHRDHQALFVEAKRLVAAALEQLREAKRLCGVTPTAERWDGPLVDDGDPWEEAPNDPWVAWDAATPDPDISAAAAVLGCEATRDAVLSALLRMGMP
jgi:hypothetical protein